jgi:Rieske Fe-S protein
MNPTLKKNLTFNRWLFLLPVLFLASSSCKKGTPQGVPLVTVDIRMYSSDPSFINLNSPGGWVYISGGNRGIVVYRRSLSDFAAYDRTCTYNPSDQNELVKVDVSNNVILSDAHCGSKFLITDGSVNQGPATLPLKSYTTSYDGNMLHIYN